jgi:hypothetical protein
MAWWRLHRSRLQRICRLAHITKSPHFNRTTNLRHLRSAHTETLCPRNLAMSTFVSLVHFGWPAACMSPTACVGCLRASLTATSMQTILLLTRYPASFATPSTALIGRSGCPVHPCAYAGQHVARCPSLSRPLKLNPCCLARWLKFATTHPPLPWVGVLCGLKPLFQMNMTASIAPVTKSSCWWRDAACLFVFRRFGFLQAVLKSASATRR